MLTIVTMSKLIQKKKSSIEKEVFIEKNISNKNVITCIFEFRCTPFDEIFFTKSKPKKSLN